MRYVDGSPATTELKSIQLPFQRSPVHTFSSCAWSRIRWSYASAVRSCTCSRCQYEPVMRSPVSRIVWAAANSRLERTLPLTPHDCHDFHSTGASSGNDAAGVMNIDL